MLSNKLCQEMKNDVDSKCKSIYNRLPPNTKSNLGIHIKANIDCSNLLYEYYKKCYDTSLKPSDR